MKEIGQIVPQLGADTLADIVAGYFVPIVVSIAVVTFIIWALVGPAPRMTHALVNAVAVLIIACPCALGLATPMSIMVATGKGATIGVLFKNAEAIEVLRKVDTLVVDKTGTLTEGKPKLVSVIPLDGLDEAGLLRLAAGLERGSEHPLAAAIVNGRSVEPVVFDDTMLPPISDPELLELATRVAEIYHRPYMLPMQMPFKEFSLLVRENWPMGQLGTAPIDNT